MHTLMIAMAVGDLGCASGDAADIERSIRGARGVVDVYVNPATDTAYIRYDPTLTDPESLSALIAAAGYRPGRPRPA